MVFLDRRDHLHAVFGTRLEVELLGSGKVGLEVVFVADLKPFAEDHRRTGDAGTHRVPVKPVLDLREVVAAELVDEILPLADVGDVFAAVAARLGREVVEVA